MFDQFEETLKSYSYKCFLINSREKIFVLEDSLILYVGLLTYNENWFGDAIKDVLCDKNEYNLRIEELTYNSIGFKFDNVKFLKDCNTILPETFCSYLKFFRTDTKTIDYRAGPVVMGFHVGKVTKQPRMIERVNNIIPSLKIKERNESWQGILYYFVVVEVLDSKNIKGFGVFRTTSKPYSYIINKGRNWIKNGFYNGNIDAVGNGFEKAFESYRGKGVKRKEILENKFAYFAIEKYVKDKLWDFAREILEKAENHYYDDIERNTYVKPVHKWKTEELVYKYIKKIYKDYNVIYQHRPFFLRGETGGQMSYDIFIAGLDIAIEYQGKQHFEPVEFFGGEEGFKRTVQRDELKRQLSIKNGVKLVYINYWENINLELLKQKINNA